MDRDSDEPERELRGGSAMGSIGPVGGERVMSKATRIVLNLAEMRALLWLLHSTDCGAIISGSEEREADLENLRAIHARVANRSIRS
jgi:hypothetical protein